MVDFCMDDSNQQIYLLTQKDVRVANIYDGKVFKIYSGIYNFTSDENTKIMLINNSKQFILTDHK